MAIRLLSGSGFTGGTLSTPLYVPAGTSTGTAAVGGVVHVSTTSAATAANTDETDLWTYTLPANSLSANGKALRVTIYGTLAANGNTKNLKAYFGAANILLAVSAGNNMDFFFDVLVVRHGASSQEARWRGAIGSAFVAKSTAHVDPTEDTTAAITIKFAGQNGTASAGDITFQGAIVEMLN